MNKIITPFCLLIFLNSLSFTQTSWIFTQGPPGGWVQALALDSAGTIYALPTEDAGGGIFRSRDRGYSWTRMPSPFVNSNKIVISTQNEFYANGQTSFRDTTRSLFLSINDGESWTEVFRGFSQPISFVVASDGQVYLAQRYRGVYRSLDRGKSWTLINNGLVNTDLSHIDINLMDKVFVGTYNGEVFGLDPSNLTWQLFFSNQTSSSVNRILENGLHHVFVATSQDGIYRTKDGNTWTRLNTTPSIAMLEIDPMGALFVDTFNYFGLAMSSDNGDTWTEVDSAFQFTDNWGTTNFIVNSVVFTNRQYLAGTLNSGGIFRSLDSGKNWEQTTYSNTEMTDLAITSNNILWATTDGAGIFQLDMNTRKWHKFAHRFPGGGNQFNLIAVKKDTMFISEFAPSKLYRSDDNGNTWILVYQGEAFDGVTSLWFTMQGDVLIGTGRGRILRSKDNGATWKILVEGLSPSRIYDVVSNLEDDIFAATLNNGVYRSLDNGATWQNINAGLPDGSKYYLAIDSQGDVFTGTRKQVFRSSDNGDSWFTLNVGLPEDISINDIFYTGINELLLATSKGVFISTDRGQTWTGPIGGEIGYDVLTLTKARDGMLFAGTLGGGVFSIDSILPAVKENAAKDVNDFSFGPNYPNPFNNGTKVKFSLAKPSVVKLTVYDVLGRELLKLVDNSLPAGNHEVLWYPETSKISNGIYIIRLQIEQHEQSIKVLYLK